MKIMCRVMGHRINRKRVRRLGESYIGRCRWCDTRMEKQDEDWVAVNDRDSRNQDMATGV